MKWKKDRMIWIKKKKKKLDVENKKNYCTYIIYKSLSAAVPCGSLK